MPLPEQPADQKTADEPVAITRYPNRRLYDRSRGRYVTLQEVAELVREGKSVVIRDSKTGEDLTRAVLTQIILEQFPERMELVPVAILHSMIQANSAVLGFLRDYFRQALAYLEVLQRSPAVNPLGLPLDWMRFFLPPTPINAGNGAAAPIPPTDAEALARRVAELEQRLDEMKHSARPPAAAAHDGRLSPADGSDRNQ